MFLFFLNFLLRKITGSPFSAHSVQYAAVGGFRPAKGQ